MGQVECCCSADNSNAGGDIVHPPQYHAPQYQAFGMDQPDDPATNAFVMHSETKESLPHEALPKLTENDHDDQPVFDSAPPLWQESGDIPNEQPHYQHERPQEPFVVTLRKTPENSRLGVAVDPVDGITLIIYRVDNGGLMWEWNQKNPEYFVMPGDAIVACNGQSGSTESLTKACKAHDVLEMTIVAKRDS